MHEGEAFSAEKTGTASAVLMSAAINASFRPSSTIIPYSLIVNAMVDKGIRGRKTKKMIKCEALDSFQTYLICTPNWIP
jgi:hypothetical protein